MLGVFTYLKNPTLAESITIVYTLVMNTVLNVKTNSLIKKQATSLAKEMGIPLSLVVTNLLKEFINKKELIIQAPRVTSLKLERVIQKAEKELKTGNTSPAFTNTMDAIAWLGI
jgi:antitoxin component of RelBE/YafQ-DinJ toxin-antitoxin module